MAPGFVDGTVAFGVVGVGGFGVTGAMALFGVKGEAMTGVGSIIGVPGALIDDTPGESVCKCGAIRGVS